MATNGTGGDEARIGASDHGSLPAADLAVRERYVLYCLATHGRMALWDVADELTVWETDTRLPDCSPAECRTRYLALYHTHVPRLERAGLAEYLPDRDLVALADEALGVACREPSRPAAADDRAGSPHDH